MAEKPSPLDRIIRNPRAAAGAAGLSIVTLAAAAWATGNAPGAKADTRTQDERLACLPEGEQEFTFTTGQGIYNAVVKIKGSGRGKGDPCWSEAVKAVEHQVGGHVPQEGQEITIPEEMIPGHGGPDAQQTGDQ